MEYLGNKELLTMQKTAFLASGTIACLILNKVDTKSLKKYGERTQRKPLCERH
jgi:hypothetical protein